MWRLLTACALLASCASEDAGERAPPVDDASAPLADAGDRDDTGAAPNLDDEADADAERELDATHVDAAAVAGDAAAEGDGRTPGAPPEPSIDSLLRTYRAWTAWESAPESISTQIAALCRLPTSAEEAFAESQHGDYRFLQNFLNDQARSAFASKQTPFPLGAAIVKEKLKSGAVSSFELVARGVMIKREAGFDPAHGDWQFGYWEPASGLTSDRTTADHCGSCHAGAKTDFVFLDRSWRIDLDAGG